MRNIYQRVNDVMKDLGRVRKEKKRGMQYAIVSHDAVTALARPLFVEHGIIHYPVDMTMRQDGNRTEMKLKLRVQNVDDPADFLEVSTAGYGVDTQDKGPGKAMSYAVKYGVLKLLQMETGDDPDLDQGPSANHKKGSGSFDDPWV